MDCHADVVGSLLRPARLLEARKMRDAGLLDAAAFRVVEDAAVDAAVRLQEEVGLPVVTDGEMRRLSFQAVLAESVEGFGNYDLDAFLWGRWHGDGGSDDVLDVSRPAGMGVVDRIRRRRSLAAEELAYLRARTGRVAKVALPSPSLWVNFWSKERSSHVYPTWDSFLADVVDVMRAEVDELAALGAAYIQIDAPHYTAMLDPGTRAFYEASGWTMERWLDRGIEMDNAVMRPRDGLTFGIHVCRGNQRSRWLVEGSYAPLAGAIFRGTRASRLLLEYDDERSGGFEPLASVPEDRTVVLGLVTTKSPRRETVEELAARVREASRYVPLSRLALSPQCGFASSILGNEITEQDQRRKLALVVETARHIWGSSAARES